MDRSEFGRLLSSNVIHSGSSKSEILETIRLINEALDTMMPRSLFRYRSGKDDYQIEAFEQDKIYAVPPEWCNDPYDTLPRCDYDRIRRQLETAFSPEWLEQLKRSLSEGKDFPDDLKRLFPENFRVGLKERILKVSDFREIKEDLAKRKDDYCLMIKHLYPELILYLKRFCTIACFSEDVKSMLMWSHYANDHKGFALEYDFSLSIDNLIDNPLGKWLFPVIYSDERYDATSLITWAFLEKLGLDCGIQDVYGIAKMALYKSKVWEYEKEWRIIDLSMNDIEKPIATTIVRRPMGIYYGTRIEDEKLEKLHKIAVAKGIKEFKMVVDSASKSYEMQYFPAVFD